MPGLDDVRSQLKLLTFDCYGTLVDWEQGIAATLAQFFGAATVKRHNLVDAYVRIEAGIEQLGYAPYRDVQARTLRALAGEYHLAFPADGESALTTALPDWPVFPDTNAALRRLKRRYRLAILSNIDDDLLEGTCRRFDVAFDFVVTAQQVRAYKPAHLHFLRMRELADGPPAEVLHVAQSLYHDARPAAELGLSYVWINRYGQPRPADVPMLAEFPSLAKLADALGV